MSQQLITNFFPNVVRLLHDYVPTVYELTFPAWTAITCPIPVTFLGGVRVQWLGLALAAVVGALVGFVGGIRILTSHKGSSARFSMGLAFLWFGCMNTDGLFFHCLLTSDSTLYSTMYACDIAFTSCSSQCLLWAALVWWGALRDDLVGIRVTVLVVNICTIVSAFIMADAWWVPLPGQSHAMNFINEMLYLGVTAIASGALAAEALQARRRLSQTTLMWLCFTTLGAALFLVPVPLDPYFCFLLGSQWTSPVMGFVGCDVGFIGLAGYWATRQHQNENNNNNKKKKKKKKKV